MSCQSSAWLGTPCLGSMGPWESMSILCSASQPPPSLQPVCIPSLCCACRLPTPQHIPACSCWPRRWRGGVGELFLSGTQNAETAYLAEQRTLGFNLQWNWLVMSFLLIARGGIFWKRGQSTKCSWSTANIKVIDPARGDKELPPSSFNSKSCFVGIPYLESQISRNPRVGLENWVGKQHTPFLKRFIHMEVEHENHRSVPFRCFSLHIKWHIPRGGPWRLMLSTDPVYLWNYQRMENMGSLLATSHPQSMHPARVCAGDTGGDPALLLLCSSGSLCLKGRESQPPSQLVCMERNH